MEKSDTFSPSNAATEIDLTPINAGFTVFLMGIQEIIANQKEQILAIAGRIFCDGLKRYLEVRLAIVYNDSQAGTDVRNADRV